MVIRLDSGVYVRPIVGLQSISRNAADNVSQPQRLDPTMELTTWPPWRYNETINIRSNLIICSYLFPDVFFFLLFRSCNNGENIVKNKMSKQK